MVEGSDTPIILGNGFFAKHKAVFDFDSRVIKLHIRCEPFGKVTLVPFELGDEKSTEDTAPVFSLEDRVIPPGHACAARPWRSTR